VSRFRRPVRSLGRYGQMPVDGLWRRRLVWRSFRCSGPTLKRRFGTLPGTPAFILPEQYDWPVVESWQLPKAVQSAWDTVKTTVGSVLELAV